MVENLRNNKAITLVALVITIIILLILAGISIVTLTGSGLFEKAILAEQESKNAQEKEKSILEEYEKQIENSRETVTIDKEEYEKLVKTVNEIRPTGIRTDAYVKSTTNNTSIFAWHTITSKNGMTNTKDENDNISKYISYSSNDGYTVLKSGWYFVRFFVEHISDNANNTSYIFLYVNDNVIATEYTLSMSKGYGVGGNGTSIYLKEGDKFYFDTATYGTSRTSVTIEGVCYPMF